MGTFFRRLSIQLYLVVSLCFTIATLSLIMVSVNIQQRTLIDEAEQNLDRVASAFQTNLDVILNTRQQGLVNLADNLQRWGEDHPSLADEAGLRQLFDHVWVVNRAGVVIDEWPRLGAAQERLNLSQNSMFQSLLDGNNFILTAPQPSYYNNEMVVHASVPVFDSDGSFLGAVVGVFSLRNNEVLNRIVTTRIGDSGHVAIVDHEGYVVGHPDRLLLGSQLSESQAPLVFSAIQSGWQGVEQTVGINGEAILQAVKPVATGKWIVVAQVSLREAMRPVRFVRNVQWVLGFVALVVTLGLLSVIVHAYLRPLTRLQDEVAAVQRGHQEHLTEPGILELRNLVYRFNNLLAQNAASKQSLQRRQAYLDQILATSSAGLFMANRKGQIEYVNQRMVDMTGYDTKDLIKNGFVKQLNEQHRAHFTSKVKQAIDDVATATVEVQLRHNDGKLVWLRIETSPVLLNKQCVGHVGTVTDITSEREKIDALRHAALQDTLTGLLNRRGLEKAMHESFQHSVESQQPLVLVMIDLDNFKQVNDTHGHAFGDRVLSDVAQVMRSFTRESDVIGRLGGDEFVVMLPGCTLERAQQVADGLIRAVAKLGERNQEAQNVQLSVGICQRLATDDNYAELLTRADHAAYEAKRAGGSRWVLA